MNGAENMLKTLEAAGIEVCFANPGTSEMQLVSAIGNSDSVRPVLCLFEGVVSGAADGYGRMADKPALTLLHVGSGYANSMANLHNAMRAGVPLVNMVGDHATYHLQYDAPLTSDVPAHVAIHSDWWRASQSADDLALAAAEAVAASQANNGQISGFIAPANHAWEEATQPCPPLPVTQAERVSDEAIRKAAEVLRKSTAAAIGLDGRALREESLRWAGRIARKTGARLICPTFFSRLQRGAGRVPVNRLPYFGEQVVEALTGLQDLVLIGMKPPVSFFAYPGKPSWLSPKDAHIETLAERGQDLGDTLRRLAEALDATEDAVTTPSAGEVPAPSGVLSPMAIGQSLVGLLPDHAIVVDEANTCSLVLFPATEHAAPHDWLTNTGGAIGLGLPQALGASIACPDRKVVALQADGSAMYTLQALWSMAREQCDVTVVLLNNRSYAILNVELARVGAGRPTPKTLSMLDLSRPDLDFVGLAQSMGVTASRARSAEEFHQQFRESMQQRGPRLIEAMVIQQMPG